MAEETTTTTETTKTDDGLSAAARAAAEAARKADEAALQARLAQDSKIKKLEESITEFRESARSDVKSDPVLARQLADMKAELAEEKARRVKSEERAARKTIDADARAILGKAKVLDADAALRYMRDDLRVDDDGKVAVRLQDGADQWGSLTEENLSKRLPAIFFAPKGSPGAGSQGSREEAKTPDVVEAGKRSQKEFNKNFDEIKAAVKATEEPIGG